MARTSWFLEIVQVASLQQQQQVLQLFQTVPGLTVFGASGGSHHIVGFMCDDQSTKSAADVLLAEIDPNGVCIYDSGPLDVEPTTP